MKFVRVILREDASVMLTDVVVCTLALQSPVRYGDVLFGSIGNDDLSLSMSLAAEMRSSVRSFEIL